MYCVNIYNMIIVFDTTLHQYISLILSDIGFLHASIDYTFVEKNKNLFFMGRFIGGFPTTQPAVLSDLCTL